jgi:hypothetical protein
LSKNSQDGALANAVGTNYCCVFARGNFEAHIKKQLIRAWWAVFKFAYYDAAHPKESVGEMAQLRCEM